MWLQKVKMWLQKGNWIRVQGCNRDGYVTASDNQAILNTGVYSTHSIKVGMCRIDKCGPESGFSYHSKPGEKIIMTPTSITDIWNKLCVKNTGDIDFCVLNKVMNEYGRLPLVRLLLIGITSIKE